MQLQQLSCADWQLALALSHLLAAQSSPASCFARSHIFCWLLQIDVESVHALVHLSVFAGWHCVSLTDGVTNGWLIASAQAAPAHVAVAGCGTFALASSSVI